MNEENLDNLSKRQRRALRREERRRELASGGGGGNSRALIWIIGVVVVVGILGGLIYLAATARPKAEAGVLADPVTAGEWIKGSQTASTTLVEYSDFQCPACGFYYPLVKRLGEDFPNDLRIAYRHFPLRTTHPNAEAAALVAEAAGAQGKFWEMHNLLFDNQKVWSEQLDPSASFLTYATMLKLDLDEFKTDMGSQAVKDKVENDFQSGVRSGVNSTPSFFLNGRRITNPQSYDQFRELISQTLGATTTAP